MNASSYGPVRQNGAALVIGLVLLIVLTILAVSGVFGATMELRMAANSQLQERAFQAAEVAIEEALANPAISTSTPEFQAVTDNPNSPDDEYTYNLAYVCTSSVGISSGQGTGSSIGTTFSAYHFQVDASGNTKVGNAQAQHTQGFLVIGPQSAENC